MWRSVGLLQIRRSFALGAAAVLVTVSLSVALATPNTLAGAAGSQLRPPSLTPAGDSNHDAVLVFDNPRTIFGPGYDLVGTDGGVFVLPTTNGGIPVSGGFFGSLPGLGIRVNNIVGMVPTNEFQPGVAGGYDLVGSDGGVFVFPTNLSSGFYGSLPGLGVRVNNIVGLVPTANDTGYFLVGSDGGVFGFNAPFENSLPGKGINVNNIVGIAATADDRGYWLVSSTGSVYALGDATQYGDLGGASPTPIVGIAATPDGKGYLLVGKNGAVYPYGDAASFGDLPTDGISVDNIVSIVPTSFYGPGYLLIGADGGVYAFGSPVSPDYVGSLPGLGIHVNNVVGAVPTVWVQP